MAKAVFFASPEAFGAWLEERGGSEAELLVGYWKVGTGRPSMTWAQSVEQALRFGWIDGVRRSLGPDSYCIRFTPRRRGSMWSAVNVATATRLVAEGRMAPAGLRAFEARATDGSATYSYGQRKAAAFTPAERRRFQADAQAWANFAALAPSYRSAATFWVVSAKRPETRARRLGQLVARSRAGRRVGVLEPRKPAASRRRPAKTKRAKRGKAVNSK